jgi:cytoskeletal protein CcmA (bactofilin family)
MANSGTRANGMVTLGETTTFNGKIRFTQGLTIRGKFYGTIESGGDLIIDKGAVVDVDKVNVRSLIVKGKLNGEVHADDKVDFWTGSEIKGDVSAGRIRIADGVLFEGNCNMVHAKDAGEVEIFSRPIDEIKQELKQIN